MRTAPVSRPGVSSFYSVNSNRESILQVIKQSGRPAWPWCLIRFICLQAYIWDNNKDLVEWLEKQLTEEDGIRSVIEENIKYISRDYVLKQIRR